MSFMMLLVTMIVSSAVVASSFMARYTICRNALWWMDGRVREEKKKTWLVNKTDVLVLKQLGGAKKEGGGLMRSKCLSDVEQINHACEESSAFPWVDGGVVE